MQLVVVYVRFIWLVYSLDTVKGPTSFDITMTLQAHPNHQRGWHWHTAHTLQTRAF